MNDEFEPYDAVIQHKEIDLIQSIITRMSNFQMTVKGMCLTLLGFLFTLAVNIKSLAFVVNSYTTFGIFIISLIALKTCRNLDVNYLKTENLYRAWFEFIVQSRHKTKAYLFELNPKKITHILSTEDMYVEHQLSYLNNRAEKSWAIKFYKGLKIILLLLYPPIIISPYIPAFLQATSIHELILRLMSL